MCLAISRTTPISNNGSVVPWTMSERLSCCQGAVKEKQMFFLALASRHFQGQNSASRSRILATEARILHLRQRFGRLGSESHISGFKPSFKSRWPEFPSACTVYAPLHASPREQGYLADKKTTTARGPPRTQGISRVLGGCVSL